MPWKPIDVAPTPSIPAAPAVEPEAPQFAPPETRVSKFRDLFTGENRTEFPDMPEFLQAYTDVQAGQGARIGDGGEGLAAITNSAISSDPKAQLDILRKNIPGLAVRPDKYGNIMVKAPHMKGFAYLNKPGTSSRDIDELGTQTLATLPLLGMGGMGTSTLGKMLYGAAGLGGASVAEDALATAAGSDQGISPEKAAISAGLGAVGAGVVEPILGKGLQALGKAATYPMSRVRAAVNPDAEARRRILGAGAEDARAGGLGFTQPQVATARARGQDPRVVDVGGDAIRAEARRAANIAPTARQEFTDFVQDRFMGQSERYSDFISQLVRRQNAPNLPPNAFNTREALQTAAQSSVGARYRPAYAAGSSGLDSPLLRQLSAAPAMRPAMRRANSEIQNRVAAGRSRGARGANGFTLEFWDLTKRRLDDRIQSLKRSGAKSEALDLDSIRVQLLKELDRMVPEYAGARGTAESFFKARDALEAGENFVGGKFDLNQARAALGKMTQEERDLFAEGFASRYIERINKVNDRRSILNSINSSRDARERLTIALGSNRSRAVESFLRAEQLMDLARTALGNSTTARQLVELGLGGYGLYNQDPNTLMIAALSFGSRTLGRQIDRRVAERVVQQLLSPDTNTFLQGVRQIASSPMLDALRAFDKAVQKLGIVKSAGSAEGAEALAAPAPNNAAPNSLPGRTPEGPLPGPNRLPPPGGGPSTPQPRPGPGSAGNNNDLRAAAPELEEDILRRYGLVPQGVG